MISDFQLLNFKCFSDATFSLGKITLLAGLNGTGKSSVIQGLLAFRHLREWRREGGAAPSLAGVRSEGPATMDQFGEERAHRNRHGKKETYKLHVSAGSCRIHFRVESAGRMIEIGYVGRHLPTKQFH